MGPTGRTGAAVGAALLAWASFGWSAPTSADPPATIAVVDGVTAPVFGYADAIRERVYIPVEGVDQDRDGITDVTAIDIIRPAASDDDLRVPVIIDPSPYYTTLGRGIESEKIEDLDGDGIPDVFPFWYDNYFVPRGYAVILAQMNGTAFSTGCPMHGGAGDIASMRVVIDWLQGRVPGYDGPDPEDADEVVADWDNGRAAMIGKSYDGTLANGVAATGVEGLTTIVPITAISNWYDYSRTGGLRHNTNYPSGLSNTVTNGDRRELCKPTRDDMEVLDGDDTGDMNPFWDERNYLPGAANVHASVFAVQGLNDDNVRMNHLSQWWEALSAHDVPRKLWLTRLGHVDPFDFRRDEWIDTLHRWFDHWLQGIDNGIMDEPMVTVEVAPEVYQDTTDWPVPGTETVEVFLTADLVEGEGDVPPEAAFPGDLQVATPGDADAPATSYLSSGVTEANAMNNPTSTALLNRRVFLSEPLTQDLRISGTPYVTLRASVDGTEVNVAAILVEYGAASRVTRSNNGYTTAGQGQTCVGEGSEHDDNCFPNIARVLVNNSVWRVARGVLDARNRHSLHVAEDLVPGVAEDLRFPLMAHDYTFRAGNRIGLVVLGSFASGYLPTVNGRTITLDLHRSSVELPIVGGLGAAAASGAFGAPDPVTVSFDLGGHGSPIAPQVVPWGEAPTEPPAPTEEGWTFLGWFADEARTVPFDFTAPRTEDATAYAAWTINTYEVAFDLGDHGDPVPSQTVEHGSTATEPAEPAADGWRFDGWYADPARTTPFDFAEPVTSDRTAHARWSALTTTSVAPLADTDLVEGRDGAVVVEVTTLDPTAPLPEGTVAVTLDGTETGEEVPLGPDGTAQLTVPAPSAGDHDVEATYHPAAGGAWDPSSGSAVLTAASREEAVAAIELAASATTVDQGDSIELAVEGFDQHGESIGDVTDLATFESSVPSDEIDGNVVTFVHASPHTITAAVAEASASITIEVTPAPVVAEPDPGGPPIPPGGPGGPGARGPFPPWRGPLARTGAEVAGPAVAGVLALLVGLALVAARRGVRRP